jgi:hypothetical protein
MIRLLATLRRALALYKMRCLEIELHDRTEALRHVSCDQLSDLCKSRRQTQRELLAARQRYIATLEPGDCPTWRTACFG